MGIRVCGLDPNNPDDDKLDVVIPKNTVYPCERSVTKQTAKDGQTMFKIRVLQGEDEEDFAEFCHELSSM